MSASDPAPATRDAPTPWSGNSYDFPYASQRMPVLADNAVATSQPLATQAGLRALQRGGNAIDAALAAAITLTVVEPTGNGVGSDAFAIVWDGQQLHGLNASGAAPRSYTLERRARLTGDPPLGWDTVSVPGAVSAWAALSQRFGRLPFAALFDDAIHYARAGYLVSPRIASLWQRAEGRLASFESFAAAFLPGGRAPRAGERFALPDLAATLETIAATDGESFYRGSLAERIVAHARAHGAALSEADLAEHQVEWCGTLAQDYGSVTLHEIPPNGQGIAAQLALGILEHLPQREQPVDSVASLHYQIEAMKLAYADVHRYVADPRWMELTPSSLLDPAYLAERARLVDPRRASDAAYGTPQPGGTVYLSAADASGMMVSFIQSNYYGFGSGVVVPETGISLQNRAVGFSTDPAHPNAAAGGKRPFHTIIPGFLTQGGRPLAALGVMGGPMQPQGHLQLVTRLHDHGQNPQAAIDAPRWQVTGGLGVSCEPGIPEDVVAGLRALGHDASRSAPRDVFSFGGAQLIYRSDDGYVAASDPRKDGHAAGF